MKLGSLKEGRDGRLVVVSRDLKKMVAADFIAATMQRALDDWIAVKPRLEELYSQLNQGKVANPKDFSPSLMAAPLPRAYQWLDGSAYVNHVELVRKARGVAMPANFWTDPLMYQGGSDHCLGPLDAIEVASESWGIDFESEVAIITDDVPSGTLVAEAKEHIQLLVLVNDVSLRNLIPDELAKGFGFLHGKPASSFSPVAVTPDELEQHWSDCKVHLPLKTFLNGKIFGEPNAGVDMTFNFGELIHHAVKSRSLTAGTIIGSGTVSNVDRSKGSSCIVERRMLELLEQGEARTPFLGFGDQVRIEMFDGAGNSIFGAIEQKVLPYSRKEKRL